MKKFLMYDKAGHNIFQDIGLGNVYVSGYGKVVEGNAPDKLQLAESCVKEYALSGQKPSWYTIVRTQ